MTPAALSKEAVNKCALNITLGAWGIQPHVGLLQPHVGLLQPLVGLQSHAGLQPHVGLLQPHVGLLQPHIGTSIAPIGLLLTHVELPYECMHCSYQLYAAAGAVGKRA